MRIPAFVLPLVACFSATAAPLDFNLDVRPILSDRCFVCHGFDGKARKAELRLDIPEGAFAKRDNGQAIVPGKPEESLVWQRITHSDPDEIMPPPDSHLKLTSAEKEILKQWIVEGAEYKKYWALLPVKRPEVPEVPGAIVRNPIDALVASKLAKSGLKQSPEASRRALIRRLSLDLRGIPPTPEEIADYLADERPDAYEQLVDRFLASPFYGERMAWPWLDAARYADSNGYQGDGERTMWPWRDWVVDAFNRNVSWKDLTIWQLAGDLLPNATDEQKLATGFLRNHPINGEGGRIAEENRVDYVFDMTETTGTVWMALTFNCARCHDHKYDAITQEEYYQLSAFFNQTPVNGGGGNAQTPPVLEVPTKDRLERENQIKAELAEIEKKRDELSAELESKQADWENAKRSGVPASSWKTLKVNSARAEKQKLTVQEGGSVLASGDNPDNDNYKLATETTLKKIGSIRLEALRHESMTKGGLARSDSGNFVLTDFQVRIQALGAAKATPLKFVSATASFEQGDHKVTKAFDGNAKDGWAVYNGKPPEEEHEAVFRLQEAVEVPPHASIIVTLRHDSGNKQHQLGHFRISASEDPNADLASKDVKLQAALAVAPTERNQAQADLVIATQRSEDPRWENIRKEIEGKNKAIQDNRRGLPKVMVMQDMDKPRKTYVLKVGLYDKRDKEVTAGTPASLLPFGDLPRNRLGLARWLVDPNHPLASRVTVNRFWQEIFGLGLIKSPENFGVQSEVPIHPRLLDWLAAEFLSTDWDVKNLLRTIVTSHTYRQSSKITPELLEADPENRLLARASRFRMPAWMIRDQALSAGGLLVSRQGGSPVNSYQPEGIWAEATFGKKRYSRGKGEDLYRRSLYSFWRRIAAPPMFFDNPGRETCSVKSSRTNTPLHALNTLNDTTYVEAARALAARAASRAKGIEGAIEEAFALVLSRLPKEREKEVLDNIFNRAQIRFTADPDSARKFLANGDSPRNSTLEEVTHAALATVCLGILNLDETLTKE